MTQVWLILSLCPPVLARGPHWTEEVCLDWEIFNQDGTEREELGEANFLLLTFFFLSAPFHFSQSRLVCITPSTSDYWRVTDPSSPLTYSHGSNIQACRFLENSSHPGWDMMITNSRASPTRWTWAWAGSGSWWWTGKPGVLQSMESQRVGHNWVTELNWILEPGLLCLINCYSIYLRIEVVNWDKIVKHWCIKKSPEVWHKREDRKCLKTRSKMTKGLRSWGVKKQKAQGSEASRRSTITLPPRCETWCS